MSSNSMEIAKRQFGFTSELEEVSLYEITNKNGMKVVFTDYGANIVSIIVPDQDGTFADVALGFDSVEGYEINGPGFGSFLGRCANRIGGAKFTLNGVSYELEKNDGSNCLHSSNKSYNKYMYQTKIVKKDDCCTVEFSRLSKDMEQGFPGNLNMVVSYTLNNENELILSYHATTDKDTVVNLTNHSYFNLDGHNAGSILDHQVRICASRFTPTDEFLIPTGELREVAGTPMDFCTMKSIGRDICADYEPLKQAGGYDHNYVLDKKSKGIELCATVIGPKSKRRMDVYTDLPGMQFYTGNFLNNKEHSKDFADYKKQEGVCFETQFYPNSCNIKEFPSPILKAGEEYSSTTIFKFSCEK